jgi:hypothetical protein
MSSPTRNFVRHYLEMVASMLLGMVVLWLPLDGALQVFGSSIAAMERDAPAAGLLAMATIMTVPMVGWMRHRGHGWVPCVEMSASMYVPTFAVTGLLAGSVISDYHTLMGIQHSVMFPAMLVAMLLRPAEYKGAHHAHGHATAPQMT